MKLLGKLIICIMVGSIIGWFTHVEYVKRYKSEWKQVENREVKQKVEKPIRMVIQKSGLWYVGSEKDVLKNQK